MVLLQSAPSWDLIIILCFAIGMTYGFVMMRDRIIVGLLAVYAGTFMANTLAGPIGNFFSGNSTIMNKVFIQSSASPFDIKIVVFLMVVIVVAMRSGLKGRSSGFSFIEIAAYSFFMVALALSSIFGFMDPAKLATYTTASHLVSLVVSNQLLWMVGPFVVLAILGTPSRSRNNTDY